MPDPSTTGPGGGYQPALLGGKEPTLNLTDGEMLWIKHLKEQFDDVIDPGKMRTKLRDTLGRQCPQATTKNDPISFPSEARTKDTHMPPLADSLSSASPEAIQRVFDWISCEIDRLREEGQVRDGVWSAHFPITATGTVLCLPEGINSHPFNCCLNLPRLAKSTGIFVDTNTGTLQSGFWVENHIFLTSLHFGVGLTEDEIRETYSDIGLPRFVVMQTDTGVAGRRKVVRLKGCDMQANIGIFQLFSSSPTKRLDYGYIRLSNLVEEPEIHSICGNQIYSGDSIAAIGYTRMHSKFGGDLKSNIVSFNSCLLVSVSYS